MGINLIIEKRIDKRDWNQGKWTYEPDCELWVDESTSYPCVIVRDEKSGGLRGHVGIPQNNPIHGCRLGEIPIDSVHGGLTQAGDVGPELRELHPAVHDESYYWLGMDCEHGDDFVPGEGPNRNANGPYRDWGFVRSEITALALKLAELEKEVDQKQDKSADHGILPGPVPYPDDEKTPVLPPSEVSGEDVQSPADDVAPEPAENPTQPLIEIPETAPGHYPIPVADEPPADEFKPEEPKAPEEPKTEEPFNPVIEPDVQPDLEPSIEPDLEPTEQSEPEPVAEPGLTEETVTEPDVESAVEPEPSDAFIPSDEFPVELEPLATDDGDGAIQSGDDETVEATGSVKRGRKSRK